MVNFHEHKLWQEAYVVLMDVHTALDEKEVSDRDHEVVEKLVDSAQQVAATIADGLTRQDKRKGKDLIDGSVGDVAMTRTHLAVAWGRGLVDDEMFKRLDEKYARLSESLQNYR